MKANPDFKELLQALNDAGAEYLVVGAHALAAHGFVRATKDLDVWVNPTLSNADAVYSALEAFGAPLQSLTRDDLIHEDLVFQIGVAPLRIDVLTHVKGLRFEPAWKQRVEATYGGEPIPVLSREHLIQAKKAAGRARDLADIEDLLALDHNDDG